MLSVQNVSPGQAGSYYQADDYYTAGSPPTQWLGKGAEALELNGEVDGQVLRDALHGHLPGGVDMNNASVAQRRAATDLTLSAPKSVSIAALVDGDQRVMAAHNLAVERAMVRAEQYIQARATENGVTRSEATGNAVIAAVRHDTSRAGDPQLHTHCLMINATQRADGEWRAIENREILKHQKEIDALYKCELAAELRQAGYDILPTKDGFELAHVSREQIEEFSRRSEAVEKALAGKGLDRDSASAEQKQAATLATRDRKVDFDRAQLAQEWRERAKPFEPDRVAAVRLHHSIKTHLQERTHGNHTAHRNTFDSERAGDRREPAGNRRRNAARNEVDRSSAGQRMPDLLSRATDGDQARTVDSLLPGAASGHSSIDNGLSELDSAGTGERNGQLTAKSAVDHAKAHCTERESVARVQDIKTEAYRVAIAYGIRPSEIDAEIERQTRDRVLIVGMRESDGCPIATTADAQRTEARILAVEQRGRDSLAPVLSNDLAIELADRHRLSTEQARAVGVALTTPHQVVGIEGRAGTGKTTTLAAIREGAEAQGFNVVGLAPTNSAVKAMAEAGIEHARTSQGWLNDRDAPQQLDTRTVLIIDEAGLMGSKDLAATLERAERAGARVVLIGDTRQYQAVDAGKPLAQLAKHGMATAEISQMHRQDHASVEVKHAAQLSADRASSLKALETLRDAGHVCVVAKSGDRRALIAQDYAKLSPEDRLQTLVLTGTNEARRDLNSRIRDALQLSGKGHHIKTFVRGDDTAAERKLIASYTPGAQIRFEKDYRSLGARAGEIWNIKDVRPDRVVIEKDGKTADFSPARMGAKGITLGTVETREIAAGDRVRFSASDREVGYSNGQTGTVLAIGTERISVRLDNRHACELDHRLQPLPLDHGYVATGHSAQGLGAHRTMIEKDTLSITTDHRSFYTDLTRTKAETTVYTDDFERLAERVTEAREKTSALEIDRPPLDFGLDAGLLSGIDFPIDPAQRDIDRELDERGDQAYASASAPVPASVLDIDYER